MFLTQKSLRKIRLLTTAYFILDAIMLVLALLSLALHINAVPDFIFLGLVILLGLLFNKWGRFAEGKGKLINAGNKLVNKELRPREFVELYHQRKNDPTNVIAEDDFDVLRLLAAAYDSLGESENVLATIDRMIDIATPKQKPLALLNKSAVLYSTGRVEEAEMLFHSVDTEKAGAIVKMIVDVVLKVDRAKALKDYPTAEQFLKSALNRKGLGVTPLFTVVNHFILAEIYTETDRLPEAEPHYRYCAEHGGETFYRQKSAEVLENLNK